MSVREEITKSYSGMRDRIMREKEMRSERKKYETEEK